MGQTLIKKGGLTALFTYSILSDDLVAKAFDGDEAGRSFRSQLAIGVAGESDNINDP